MKLHISDAHFQPLKSWVSLLTAQLTHNLKLNDVCGSGSALVEIEQAAQPLKFSNGPVVVKDSLFGERDDIVETLMIAFMLMVGEIFIERMAQGALAEENQLIEASSLTERTQRSAKALRLGDCAT